MQRHPPRSRESSVFHRGRVDLIDSTFVCRDVLSYVAMGCGGQECAVRAAECRLGGRGEGVKRLAVGREACREDDEQGREKGA